MAPPAGVLAAAVLLLAALACAQLSDPIVHDAQVDTSSNKFLQRASTKDPRINVAGWVQGRWRWRASRPGGAEARRTDPPPAARPPTAWAWERARPALPAAAAQHLRNRAPALQQLSPSVLPPSPPSLGRAVQDEVPDATCPQDLGLRWHAEVGSAIHATPLITDLFSDGRKDIIIPSFLHYLEVSGRAGRRGGSWAVLRAPAVFEARLLRGL